MKNTLLTLFLSILLIPAFSQNHAYSYRGRLTPTIKREKLNEATFICEIMPDFSRHFILPYDETVKLNDLLKLVNSPEGNYIYPQENYFCPQEDYIKVIDYVSIEIVTISQGKTLTAESTNDALTAEQRNILNVADLGSDINIKIKYKYKNWATYNNDYGDKIKEGLYRVTLVPATEAQYPGGFKEMSKYFTENVLNKISGSIAREKFLDAILDITINEEGKIVDAKLSSSSKDPSIDKLILDAATKMPNWIPAKNTKGVKVKQVLRIPFGGEGC
jgi:TonB family protein